MRRSRITLSATGLSIGLALVTGGVAFAVPGGPICSTEEVYTYKTPTSAYIAAQSKDRVYGDPGITLIISRGTTHTFTGTLGGATTAEAGVIFAKVDQQFNYSASFSRSATTTTGASYTVPSNQHPGWLEMGDHAYNVPFTLYHLRNNCTKVVDKTGTTKGATDSPWFKHS